MSASTRFPEVLGFAAIPIVNALSPLLLFRAVSGALGSSGWAGFAVGQSVGLAFSVFVELGWGLNGPQQVALASPHSRDDLLRSAWVSKVAVFVAVAPIACIAAFFVSPGTGFGSAGVALGYAASGLSQSWYFIGLRRPWASLLTDGLVRVLGTLLAVYIVLATSSLLLSGLCLALSGLISQLSAHLLAGVALWKGRLRVGEAVSTVRGQLPSVLSRGVSSLYTALPVTLVSLVAPGSVAAFSAVERLMRMGLTGLQFVPSFLQARFAVAFASAPQHAKGRTAWRAVGWNAILGLCSALAFGVFGPFASRMLFAGSVNPSPLAFWIAGAVIMVTCVSRATGGLVLVAMDHIGSIAKSASIGAVVGVAAIPALAYSFGVVGGFAGELSAELGVLFFQVIVCARELRY